VESRCKAAFTRRKALQHCRRVRQALPPWLLVEQKCQPVGRQPGQGRVLAIGDPAPGTGPCSWAEPCGHGLSCCGDGGAIDPAPYHPPATPPWSGRRGWSGAGSRPGWSRWPTSSCRSGARLRGTAVSATPQPAVLTRRMGLGGDPAPWGDCLPNFTARKSLLPAPKQWVTCPWPKCSCSSTSPGAPNGRVGYGVMGFRLALGPITAQSLSRYTWRRRNRPLLRGC